VTDVPGAGALVVFEGAEGVGKTTQLRRLCARLESLGVPFLAVREPGGTPLGNEIRHLLLDPAQSITPRAEALLFMASRAQLVDDVALPAIEEGRIVIADRFFLSTYAYQVYGRGLDEDEIRAANAFSTKGLVPALTILLDLPVGEGLRRASARGDHDRMEQSGDAFLRRVTLAFREFASAKWQSGHPECGPVVAVDASGTEDEVSSRIDVVLSERLSTTFAPRQASNL
jgi:dTMP kinase